MGNRILTFRTLAASLLLVLATLATAASAADYPEKLVKIIVPYAPAGPTDFFAREIAIGLSGGLKANVIVENLPGAGGNIGMVAAQRAAADGYTLVFISAAQAVNMTLYNNPGYDLTKFTLVGLSGIVPNVFLAQTNLSFHNIPEMLDYARKNPGKLDYGSGGFGGSGHLSGIMLDKLAGAKLNYINYKGGGPAHADFAGGHIPMMVSDIAGALQQIAAGHGVALGVTSATRSDRLPQVPSVTEFVPGYESVGWYGLLAPSNTPAPILARLRAEAEKVLTTPDHAIKLVDHGASRPTLTEAQKNAWITTEIGRWAGVIRDTKLPKLD